jgi:hypothetical protein
VRDGEPRGTVGWIHLACAVSFFACIAYVSIFRASDTLSLIRDTDRAKGYRTAYRWLGIAMIAAVALGLALDRFVQQAVFFLEAAGVTVFAAYWLVKSKEMRETHADELALAGELLRVETPKSRKAPGQVIRQGDPSLAMREMVASRGGS